MLAALLAAHALGDFVFQSRRDVEQKSRPAILLKHSAIHAGVAYVLVGLPSAWPIPLIILLTHLAIDAIKTRTARANLRSFVIDQLAHIAVIIAIAAFYSRAPELPPSIWSDLFGDTYPVAMVWVAGFVFAVRAGAFFVDFAVLPFLEQIDLENRPVERIRGLREGGRTIGQLERALIFVFVLIDQFTAIGFLIAAKSIFRFGELRERGNRMEAEYIIIGTLISFLWAIVIALVTRAALP